MSRSKINETNITGTKLDNNKRFDIDKLKALDNKEFSKLNELYGEYRRYHGPKFTPEIWNKCLEHLSIKIKTFDDKYRNKPFGWINTIIYHQFIKELRYPENELVKHIETNSFEEMLDINDEPPPIIELTEEDIIDMAFQKEKNISIKEQLDRLIEKYCNEKEKIIYALYINNSFLTKEEKSILTNIKNRIRNIIYTPEELEKLRKNKKLVQGDKKSLSKKTNFKIHHSEKKLPLEERKARIIKRRNEKRAAKLEELRLTNPKKYKEKLKQLERYDKIYTEKPDYNKNKQQEYKKKRIDIMKQNRKDILNDETF